MDFRLLPKTAWSATLWEKFISILHGLMHYKYAIEAIHAVLSNSVRGVNL